MTSTVQPPPVSEYMKLVSIQAAKDYLRVQHNQDDAQIEGMIVAAVQAAEAMTGTDFIRKTRTTIFAAGEFEHGSGSRRTRRAVPLPFAQDVSSITVLRGTDPLPATEYVFIGGAFLPNRYYTTRQDTAYTVTYQSGYDLTNPALPVLADLKQAVLQMVYGFYHDRTHYIAEGKTVTNIPLSARMILNQYVRHGY